MSLNREALPATSDYCDAHGIPLAGRSKWRTGPCPIHGGSDSLRVNTASGGWCCMACGASGGDALALHMAIAGMDFVEAARDLGAWVEDGRPGPTKPAAFSARDALTVLGPDLHLIAVVVADVRKGLIPVQADWDAFLAAASRVLHIAEVAR
jgi:hypothetical protein